MRLLLFSLLLFFPLSSFAFFDDAPSLDSLPSLPFLHNGIEYDELYIVEGATSDYGVSPTIHQFRALFRSSSLHPDNLLFTTTWNHGISMINFQTTSDSSSSSGLLCYEYSVDVWQYCSTTPSSFNVYSPESDSIGAQVLTATKSILFSYDWSSTFYDFLGDFGLNVVNHLDVLVSPLTAVLENPFLFDVPSDQNDWYRDNWTVYPLEPLAVGHNIALSPDLSTDILFQVKNDVVNNSYDNSYISVDEYNFDYTTQFFEGSPVVLSSFPRLGSFWDKENFSGSSVVYDMNVTVSESDIRYYELIIRRDPVSFIGEPDVITVYKYRFQVYGSATEFVAYTPLELIDDDYSNYYNGSDVSPESQTTDEQKGFWGGLLTILKKIFIFAFSPDESSLFSSQSALLLEELHVTFALYFELIDVIKTSLALFTDDTNHPSLPLFSVYGSPAIPIVDFSVIDPYMNTFRGWVSMGMYFILFSSIYSFFRDMFVSNPSRVIETSSKQ